MKQKVSPKAAPRPAPPVAPPRASPLPTAPAPLSSPPSPPAEAKGQSQEGPDDQLPSRAPYRLKWSAVFTAGKQAVLEKLGKAASAPEKSEVGAL